MPVLKEDCPDCGGNVHSESFIGHTGNTNAYIIRTCIGSKGVPGMDGAVFLRRNRDGCGHRAKKTWDSEDKENTEEWNEDWEKWQ